MSTRERVSEVQQFLATAPIFQNLAVDQLRSLADIAIARAYRKNETLFLEGDEGTGFFIVKSGRIKVFKVAPGGKEQILHLFGPGEHFAEVPALDGGRFPASAAAMEKSEVVFVPKNAFLAVLEQHPSIAIVILTTFARHLRRLTALVDTLSFQEVPERLAGYLVHLAEKAENPDRLDLDLSKGQLAALLGTIPETLSRALYKLDREGTIAVEGSSIRLLDRSRLEKLAGGNGTPVSR
jgi:CRP/FNR family transcriptional regulator